MDKKIVIAATFRDFNGNANDQIQRLFLKSIRNQTHQNYLLAVTTFREKNVARALSEEGVSHVIFQGDAGEHRYSLTQVMLNGIKVSKEYKDSIMLWTTSDVVFDPHFFENIAARTGSQTCGTSYPHTMYDSVEDYAKRKSSGLLWYGIDSIFYSSDVFEQPMAEESLRKYPNEGWGHGDYFFVAFGNAFYKNLINIRRYSKINRITNDRKAANETTNYFADTDTDNLRMYRRFINDFNLKTKWSNSMATFLSFKFDSIKDIWIKAYVYAFTLTYPIKRAFGIAIHNVKVMIKKASNYSKDGSTV